MKCIISKHYVFDEDDVKILLEHFGSYRKMGKALGYSGSYCHDILSNRRKAPAKFIYLLKQHFDITKLWYYEEEEPVIKL